MGFDPNFFFEKIKKGLTKTRTALSGLFAGEYEVDDEFYDELEERLILADLGVHEMVLITNTHRNVVAIDGYGLNIVDQRSIPEGSILLSRFEVKVKATCIRRGDHWFLYDPILVGISTKSAIAERRN